MTPTAEPDGDRASARHQQADRWVDEWGVGSFPASDPSPAWGGGVGGPARDAAAGSPGEGAKGDRPGQGDRPDRPDTT